MSSSRVLITGGAGFIGSHVATDLTARGHEVVLVSSRDAKGGPHRTLRCDLLTPEAPTVLAAEKADVLIHLAWETTHGKFWNAPANLDWVAATLRIARAFREAGGRRFVGVGTCIEYDTASADPLDEIASALKPKTLYGVAKHATREILESYAAETGLEFAWARVFHLFGPHEKPTRLVPYLIATLLRSEEAKTGAGTERRNFIHAADAGRAIAAVAMSDLAGPVNIGAYEHTCVAEIAQIIGDLTGKSALLRIGALPTKADEPASLVPKLDRLAALGFTPRYDLASGLADVIRSFTMRSES